MKINSIYRKYETKMYSDFSFVDELTAMENSFVVIDSTVRDLYTTQLSALAERKNVYILEAVETNKTVDKAMEIIDEMVKLPSKRNTNLIAIGGGIVQDVCCFIATVLYRGIDWYLVPTTLLAQTDSCIGSKSSINYKEYKNLIGTFYPPLKIWIALQFLNTLTEQEYFSGLGEVMKCSIMAGKGSFHETRSRLTGILNKDMAALEAEVKKALTFKKSVIEVDEFDRDYRNIMNFGHTFGHAIESASSFAVPHGQGVSIGIMIASALSVDRGIMPSAYCDDIRSAARRIISVGIVKPEYLEPSRVLPFMRKDKKYCGNMHTCILPVSEGVKKYKDVSDEEVIAALQKTSVFLISETV